jgi:hypothetical protein
VCVYISIYIYIYIYIYRIGPLTISSENQLMSRKPNPFMAFKIAPPKYVRAIQVKKSGIIEPSKEEGSCTSIPSQLKWICSVTVAPT